MIRVESDTRAADDRRVSGITDPFDEKGDTMVQSSEHVANGKPRKPEKPRPDFPLTAHPTGRWCKKINRRTYYFGPWSDPEGALAKYNREREDLEAGRKPTPAEAVGLTVRDLVNRFLTTKRHLADTREITEGTFRDYHATSGRLVAVFGKTRLVDDLTADDFEKLRRELVKTRGPVALGNEIGRVRVVFKYATDNRLVDRPIAYGQGFRKPSKKVLRKERAKRGPKMFEAAELKAIVDKAGVPLKAMVLLGINCGLGQSDVSNLPLSAVDLDGGWLNFPRPKTGINRRCPLWKETVEALRAVLKDRPAPTNAADAELAFVTEKGNRWVRVLKRGKAGDEADPEKWTNIDAVSQEFRKVMAALKLNGHRNFYCLRRTFETIGGDSLDQVAVDHIMGHARDDMASLYRQRINDERLQKVASLVHEWIFPAAQAAK
jgi:integrase